MCILTTKRLVPSITAEKTYRLNKYADEVSLLFSSSQFLVVASYMSCSSRLLFMVNPVGR